MIINFPYLKLPEDYINLLKTDYREGQSKEKSVESFLKNNPGLRVLVEQESWENNVNHSINSLMKSYGWKLIRDKLAAFYLNRFEFGTFEMHQLEPYFLKEILDMEDRFFEYSTSGGSRIFLLGFYLKMCEFNLNKKIGSQGINIIEKTKCILPFLKLRTTRSLRTDWLILIVWHLTEYFGEADFIDSLKKCEFDYQNLYREMDDNYKKTMLQNLMNYGASIDDEYVLLNDIH